MDIHHFLDRHSWIKKLFPRMGNPEKNHLHSKSSAEILSIARGTGMLLISILLGWIGKSYTENKTRNEVLTQEWPNHAIWVATLHQGGWKRVEKSDFSNLIKNLPDAVHQGPMIWESPDHCLILLVESPYANLQSGTPDHELWSCAIRQPSPSKKNKWKLVGSGYSGLNLLTQFHFSKPKTASYIDPNEIRY
jgi:hypothetical protein